MRETTSIENQLIREKKYDNAGDPTKKIAAPSVKEEVPFLNFAALQNSMNLLGKATTHLSELMASGKLTPTQKNQVNTKLYQAEQKLLSANGLPRRGWYRHTIYAPGFYTGYGVKTLPGIREAVEQRNWKEAQDQMDIDANTIHAFAEYLENTVTAAQ